jgi:hypothetical protein
MYTNPKSREIQSSVIACPVCGSTTVKRTSRYGSFWGCSRYPGCHGTQPFKIDRQGHPAATARLRSSIKPTRSHRSQGRVEAGEALPEEVTSLSGSSVQAARLSTWWKRPGGSLALTAQSEPSSTPDFSPDLLARERATLPWQ